MITREMVLRQPRPEVSCPRDRHRRGGRVKVKKRSNELKRQLRCYAVLRSVLRTVLRFSTVLNDRKGWPLLETVPNKKRYSGAIAVSALAGEIGYSGYSGLHIAIAGCTSL